MSRDDCVHYVYIFIIDIYIPPTIFIYNICKKLIPVLHWFFFFFYHFQFAAVAVLISLSLIVSSLHKVLLIHFAYDFRAFSYLLCVSSSQLFERFLTILIFHILNFDRRSNFLLVRWLEGRFVLCLSDIQAFFLSDISEETTMGVIAQFSKIDVNL